MTSEPDREATMVAIDGRDALAFVIIRPADDGKISVEAAAKALSKHEAARVLRHVAALWDEEDQ
ncbi:hypothetical protein DY218_27145 [Streptomyces triticagri]|uniref:Uncharacterized protein n=1 Tax=Streptomyces triticagri TaxID=2293568 RepID=A0A372LZX3_9ACTN|nr:hypothetical protein [Streptomyces triticagri]RFU83587.1 hypothetical protein DY218_27145 [Streptomyces triticagri]